MLKSGDILELRPLGMKMLIQKGAAETNGNSFEMEMELSPQTGGTPIHIHPQAVESYQVREGKFDVYVNGAWKTLSVDESITVEKGVPHTFRNATNALTRVYNIHQPAMRFDGYFEGLSKVANSGVIQSSQMTLKAILYLAVLMTSYPDEIQSVNPPAAVMRVFGGIGRALGYKV